MNRPGRNAAGFTLLEVMAVVVIVGIMASLVVVGFHDSSSSTLHDEAYRLKKSLQLARQEAMTSGKDYGFVLHENNSYQFYYFDDVSLDWVASQERYFNNHALPAGIEVNVTVERQVIDLRKVHNPEGSDKIRDYGDEKILPAPLLLSDGQTSEFELIVTEPTRHQEVRLTGNGLSDIVMSDGEKI